MLRKQSHRGPEPGEDEEGKEDKYNSFLIDSMQTACRQCNSNVPPFLQWTHTNVSFQRKITIVKH